MNANSAYGTATQWDLFKVLESHALSHGVLPSVASFTEIMESWTLQPGYPLIRVKYVSDRAVLVSQVYNLILRTKFGLQETMYKILILNM